MSMSQETRDELFKTAESGMKLCLHELRVQPFTPSGDDPGHHGYIARMVGHDYDGKPVVIDFVTTEETLKETMTNILTAGLTANLLPLVENGEVEKALMILDSLGIDDEGEAK